MVDEALGERLLPRREQRDAHGALRRRRRPAARRAPACRPRRRTRRPRAASRAATASTSEPARGRCRSPRRAASSAARWSTLRSTQPPGFAAGTSNFVRDARRLRDLDVVACGPAAGSSSNRPMPSWIDVNVGHRLAAIVDDLALDVGGLADRGLRHEVDPARHARRRGRRPRGTPTSCSVFITIGIRFWIDSVTPPSSARIVSRPSPRAICAGSVNRASALPSRSVLIASRATSTSSIVTTPVSARVARTARRWRA